MSRILSSFQRFSKIISPSIHHAKPSGALLSKRELSSESHSDHPFPSVKGRNFLTLKNFTSDEIHYLLWCAADLKARFKDPNWKYLSESFSPLSGKSAALIFLKRSTRTRISMETGLSLLGCQPVFLTDKDIHLGVNENIYDTARVLSGFVDIILARVNKQEEVESLANNATVPVVSGLSDLYHPLQILADLQTLQEHFGSLYNHTVAWVGDGNNILHSFLMAAPKMGMKLQIATPKGYDPDPEILKDAMEFAKEFKTTIELTRDPREACEKADVVVTDTWVSMGQEEESAARLKAFQGYQVNKELMSLTNQDSVFLHCLPRHPEEVTDDVFYSEKSLIWQEAENRKWTAMAVMLCLLENHTPNIPMPTF
ncbi:predicted protein [Nematostella vectensis]|uniref:ornithine carbamoyltransferase n=1 Tax=Nematostella vectensis TaxID=45351 RepID=A7RV06_NEMVE|nr:predicted protein [Nematostella vectensis]|eukprot:XP_001636725.1 predicted protein [Nematostella vectensis]